jgi:glycosyltransferase involved in cell wall biosynthesis/putative flippase GtrA
MRLLVITQKVDIEDPVLGFFHGWIEEFSKLFRSVVVICLSKGKYELPGNVAVLSLGKEKWRSKLKYVFLLFYFSLRYFNRYDAVFVHMNEEYVFLVGWLWKIMGKKVYMWRNHHMGNNMTDIASVFCNKIFCTSKYSYTAKFKKTILMPVGIDLSKFNANDSCAKVGNSILFLGRVAKIKRVDIFIDALNLLKKSRLVFTADIYGDALPKDSQYLEEIKLKVKEYGLDNIVKFYKGVSNYKTPEIYNSHEIFVNLTHSGSYDKTIIEAMACGCLVVTINDNLKDKVDPILHLEKCEASLLSERLKNLLLLTKQEKQKIVSTSIRFTETQSIKNLSHELLNIIGGKSVSNPFRSDQIFKYVFSGVISTSVNLSILYILTDLLSVWYIISGVSAFLLSLVVSFSLQKKFTFGNYSSNGVKVKFLLFSIVAIFNLCANTAFLYIFTEIVGIYYMLSQVLAAAIISFWSFLFYRKLFSKH